LKNQDISNARLNGRTPSARRREAHDKSELCGVTMTIHKSTAELLCEMARQNGGRGDLGRTVDKLVRNWIAAGRPSDDG